MRAMMDFFSRPSVGGFVAGITVVSAIHDAGRGWPLLALFGVTVGAFLLCAASERDPK